MISEKKSSVVRALKDSGLSIEDICNRMHLRPASVRRYLRYSREKQSPKVFLIDIETSPVWVRVWGLYKQRIDYYKIINDWFTLSWAGKWLGDDQIISDCVTPAEAIARDDKRIIKSVWDVVNEADVIVAHNLVRFDMRKISARFIQHGFPKPRAYRTIDTLKQAQKHFAFSSHKLDHLNKIFSLRMKEDTDFQLWIDCEEGDKEALAYMLHYNESDVNALEDLYLKLRPYMTSTPNLGLYVDDNAPMCPQCLSKEVIEDGVYTTNVSMFKSYRCLSCGALSRGRHSMVTKEKRDRLLVPLVN